jgi:DNA mismatch repair protein MutS
MHYNICGNTAVPCFKCTAKMILDDYIDYDLSYKKKYGPKTIIFMQVGDFFELYAYTKEGDDECLGALIGADLPAICDLCNLQMTRKNKAIPEATKKNPYMAGFPLYIISKHIQTLTQNGYTVAVVKQITAPPNPVREVTDVFSPGTLLNATRREGNYLMVIYTVALPCAPDLQAVGLAAIDVTNGSSTVYETASTLDNVHASQDEVTRWMQVFAPREAVFLGKAGIMMAPVSSTCIHEDWGNDPRMASLFEKPSFQNETFEHAFNCSKWAGLLTPSEALGLETWGLARVALTALLQFVHEHNEMLAKELEPPRFLSSIHHLHLDSNSAQQLNIVASGDSGKPLLALLNRCSTAFGARLLRDRLMHPSTNVVELEARYEAIDGHMAEPQQSAAARRYLASVQDLERLARRLVLKQFSPMEWPTLVASAHAGAAALQAVGAPTTHEQIRTFIKSITATLRLDECSKYAISDIKTNVFEHGILPDVDALEHTMMTSVDALQRVANALSAMVPGDATCVKVEINERDGYVLTTTKRRWQTICAQPVPDSPLAANLRVLLNEVLAKPISASSTTVRLHHPSLAAASDLAVGAAARLKAACTEAYKQWLNTSSGPMSKEVKSWVRPIAELDVSLTNAKNASEFAYCRPILFQQDASHIKASRLRHPMIERFLSDVAYVPNDVLLGTDQSMPNGWLLYGMNAAGKSSLMKAIGLAVVMAQAGMYVAAEAFECTPFQQLFTRITSSDNIYRGLSTFVVEMTELRNILQRANDKSLVLGDELCAGTEALSGLAIVSAGLNELLKRSSTFVFATHLHDLIEIDIVKAALEAGKVRACHLHVECEPESGSLVYDRSLREGIGHKTYGLEVCRGLGLPDSFLKQADITRRVLMNVEPLISASKGSRYNHLVASRTCGLCGKAATEVHHIQHQNTADARGFHGHVHKNHGSNLVALCEACHLKQHGHGGNASSIITGYTKTTQGRILAVKPR